uniref:Uncharacterized protein n=1 Tax=Tanacetum cinerariifolium TaxID=118510 RepID=A0A6L2K4R5_TANCI|nr:hypothetical protein [Tanacetum cinerariifolium]
MIGNISYLIDYEEFDGGYVAFGGNPKGGKITGRGKFDGKTDEGFFVRYSLNSRAFRVFNNRTRIVEENLHIRFNKNTPDIAGCGPNWLFDINVLTKSMNYKPIVVENQSNVNVVASNTNNELPFNPEMPDLEDISTFNFSSDQEDADKEVDINNMDTTIQERLKKKYMFANLQGLKILTFLIKCTKLKKQYTDIIKLLEHVYVDDIIFGSTKKELYNAFKKMMHEKFQMSSIGELTFFLGLQVKQKEDGIFISQDKYVAEILKKYGFSKVKNPSTPMETQKPLLKDEDGKEVDVHIYRSMISSLMYLTSSKSDIIFAVCACARYQVAYTDSDYAGASLDRKSTIGGCQFLGCRLISWQCKKQIVVVNSTTEAKYVAALSFCGQPIECEGFEQIVDFLNVNPIMYALTVNPTVYTSCIEQFWATVKVRTIKGERRLQALVDRNKIIITESTIRRDLQLEDAEGSANPTDPHYKPTITQPSISQPQKTKHHRKPKRKVSEVPQPSNRISVADEAVNEKMDDNLKRAATTATSLDVEQDRGNNSKTQSKATPNEPGSQGTSSGGGLGCQKAIKDTVPRLDEGLGKQYASKQGRIADIDASEDIALFSTHDEQMFDADQDLDYQLVERLQVEEQKELNDEEKAKLFMQLLKIKRKFFAAKRVEEKRNKPPTQAQQRKIMCTYLKNMEGKKLTYFKNKSFDSIQKMFDRAFKRVNTFVDYRTELVEESSKKAEEEVTKRSSKRAVTELE